MRKVRPRENTRGFFIDSEIGKSDNRFAKQLISLKGASVVGEKTGKVRWFSKEKRHGMLDSGGVDIYIPAHVLPSSISDLDGGQIIAFEDEPGVAPRHRRATSIRILSVSQTRTSGN